MILRLLTLNILLMGAFSSSIAQSISIKNANVLVSPAIPSPMKETVVRTLTEEINKRTGITLKTISASPKAGEYTIALVVSTDKEVAGKAIPVNADKTVPNTSLKVIELYQN